MTDTSATTIALEPARDARERAVVATAATTVSADIARIPELDALRGLAALGVLALHTVPRFFFWAWSCVDLFFVLSGFLITGILLRNASAPGMLLSFYARRALRIWPVYYASFAIVLVMFLLAGWLKTGYWPSVPRGHWWALVFLQNTEHYWPGAGAREYIWYFDHSWSLAVEEQFYLLWPLLFLLVRPGVRTLAISSVVVLGGCIWARSQEGASFHLLTTRIDGLVLGILLAFLAQGRDSLVYRIPLRVFVYVALAALVLLLPYGLSHGRANLWGEAPHRAIEVTAFAVAYACAVAVAIRWSGARWLGFLRTRPLVHAGRLSFAIYMYSVPIGYLAAEANQYGLLTKTLGVPLLWVTSLGAAQLSYLFIEQRFLALKNLFPYAARPIRVRYSPGG